MRSVGFLHTYTKTQCESLILVPQGRRIITTQEGPHPAAMMVMMAWRWLQDDGHGNAWDEVCAVMLLVMVGNAGGYDARGAFEEVVMVACW